MAGTIIWRAVFDRSVVADLVQETFLRVFRGLPYFDRRSKLSTWICTIAHRVAIDYLRTVCRQREHQSLSDKGELAGMDLDPAAVFERDEIGRLIAAGLARLPDKFRLPLMYSAIEGLDYETVGTILDLPIGTVKTQIFRAKRMLRDIISDALSKGATRD
jgi:RNA polymerase sigma-70 factor (ECF subfamily)